MADGLLSPRWACHTSRTCDTDINGHQESIAFDITATPHDIVLGIPWLTKNNPRIDWRTRSFTLPPKPPPDSLHIHDPNLLRITPAPTQRPRVKALETRVSSHAMDKVSKNHDVATRPRASATFAKSPSTDPDPDSKPAPSPQKLRQENHFAPINFWLGGSFPFEPSS